MLIQHTNSCGRRLRGFLAGSARALLALGILVLPGQAFDRESISGAPPAGGSGGFVFGDETIGTLPILGPGAPFDLMRHLLEREACFFLEGHRLDVFGSVISAQGRTIATVHVVDLVTDTVRVTFHGRPRLVLDRGMVESGVLRLGVDVPNPFGLGAAQASLGARSMPVFPVAPGQLDLPIAPFLAANLDATRRMIYEFQGQAGAHTLLSLRATRNFLVVEQTH